MAQLQRVEGQTELKCDADKFFDVWGRKPYLISKMCPDKFPNIELNEGSWHKVGAVTTWHYVCKEIGENASVKLRVEELDEEKRCVRYSYHDGLMVTKHFNTFKSKIQVTSNGEGCIVKWIFEYEKKSNDAPEPNMYLEYVLGTAKDIDACLCKA